MPRGLFDRLTGHENAPRCRYDMANGRAEFVAEPGPAHEWRAAEIPILFRQVDNLLAEAGHEPGFFLGGATRLLSDDGAFEPDASLFINPPAEPDLREHDGYLDVRKGPPCARPRGRDRAQRCFEPQARAVVPNGGAGGMDLQPPRRGAHLGCGPGEVIRFPVREREPRASRPRAERSQSTACRRSCRQGDGASFASARPANRPYHPRGPGSRLIPILTARDPPRKCRAPDQVRSSPLSGGGRKTTKNCQAR